MGKMVGSLVVLDSVFVDIGVAAIRYSAFDGLSSGYGTNSITLDNVGLLQNDPTSSLVMVIDASGVVVHSIAESTASGLAFVQGRIFQVFGLRL